MAGGGVDFSKNENEEQVQGTLKEYLWCAFLALPWIGIQALWGSEFGAIDGMMQIYGLSPAMAKLSWIWGPITGFFTAPIVGALSDASTSKYGRRRPFMIGGLIVFTFATILFTYASKLGPSLILPAGFFGYIMIDITINVIQTPIRSFCSDQVPAHMQNTVQLMSVAFQGLGGIIGAQLQANLYQQTIETLPYLMFPVLAINLIILPLVCYVAVETPYEGKGEKVNIATPFVSIFKNLKNIDRKLGTIFAVQFFSWASLFTYWPHSTNWVQINVFGGCLQVETDPTACPAGSEGDLLAKDGNKFAGNGSTVQSAVQLVFGLLFGYLLIARILRKVKPIYSLGLAIGCVAAILTNVITSRAYAFIFIAVMGIQMSVMNAFPFAIVGAYNSGEGGLETGFQFGMMNMFICAAQFVMQFVVAATPTFTTCLLYSGILAGVACLISFFIVEEAGDERAGDLEMSADKKL